MTREERIRELKQAIQECQTEHARWSRWDRRWNWVYSSTAILSSFISVACAMEQFYFAQFISASSSFVWILNLRDHLAKQPAATDRFLILRNDAISRVHRLERFQPEDAE